MELSFEHRLTQVEDRAKSNTKRLDEMEERQNNLEKLTTAVSLVQSEQKHLGESMEEVKGKLQTLLEKPGKRWESVVGAIIAGVVGFLISKALGG